MGWLDARAGANERQPGLFAPYAHLQEVALNSRKQTSDGYLLLKLYGSHPWLADDQTQAYFYSAWMLDSFVKAAQAGVEEVTVKGTISKEAGVLGRVLYDQASAWAGYWQIIPNSDRHHPRVHEPLLFRFALTQLNSGEPVRMAIAVAEALYGSTVESMIDLGAQENLPAEWRMHERMLESRIQQVGSDLDNVTPFRTSLRPGAIAPPHLAPLVIQIIGALLTVGRQISQPKTLNASIAARSPVNIFDLEHQPVAAPGSPATRYPTRDHAALASTATSLGFDVWRLVAPEQRQGRSALREDVQAFDRLMILADASTDGPAMKRILDEIDRAAEPSRGIIIRSPQEALLTAPWSPVFMATTTAVLGGERFSKGEKFAYSAAATNGRFTHSFERLGFDPALAPPRPTRRPGPVTRPAQPAALPRAPSSSPAAPSPRSAPAAHPSDALWRYSAPIARRRWGKDNGRTAQLEVLIEAVRNSPMWEQLQTYQADIETALRGGKIEHRANEYQDKTCPWAPVYVARQSVPLAGRHWQRGDAFFLLVSTSHDGVVVTGQSDGRRAL